MTSDSAAPEDESDKTRSMPEQLPGYQAAGRVMAGARHLHPCRAIGCETQIPMSYFMCGRHWWMVAQEIMSDIWDGWREWQRARATEPAALPPAYYIAAVHAAVREVAQREGRALPRAAVWRRPGGA